MKKYTRRDFLKLSAGATALAVLPGGFFAAEKAVKKGPLVGVARGDPAKLAKAAFDAAGGIEKFVSSGDRVLIKPNIAFAANAETGATTNADIVKQVVELCLDAGAEKVVIGEHTIASAELCAAKSGIRNAVVDEKKVKLMLLTRERQFHEVNLENGRELEAVKVANVLDEVDKIINMPAAKSHSATGVSLGMKNLMGLVWDRGAFHRVDLDRAVAELATAIRPHLTLVDATRALVEGGPGGPGKTVTLNTIVAGTDIVAVDSYSVGLTQWYGRTFAGASVKHIVAAAGLGLGEIDIKKMEIKEIET